MVREFFFEIFSEYKQGYSEQDILGDLQNIGKVPIIIDLLVGDMVPQDIEKEGAPQVQHDANGNPEAWMMVYMLVVNILKPLIEKEKDIQVHDDRFYANRHAVHRPEIIGHEINDLEGDEQDQEDDGAYAKDLVPDIHPVNNGEKEKLYEGVKYVEEFLNMIPEIKLAFRPLEEYLEHQQAKEYYTI